MAGILLFIWVYKFWSVALSYLSTWAAQASKQNSNFEVKRNRLVDIHFCPNSQTNLVVIIGSTKASDHSLHKIYSKSSQQGKCEGAPIPLLLSPFFSHQTHLTFYPPRLTNSPRSRLLSSRRRSPSSTRMGTAPSPPRSSAR